MCRQSPVASHQKKPTSEIEGGLHALGRWLFQKDQLFKILFFNAIELREVYSAGHKLPRIVAAVPLGGMFAGFEFAVGKHPQQSARGVINGQACGTIRIQVEANGGLTARGSGQTRLATTPFKMQGSNKLLWRC